MKRFLTRCAAITLAASFSLAAAPVSAQTDTPQRFARSLSGNYLAGIYAGAVNDIDAAVEFYERALDDDPDSADLLQRTFFLMLATGRLGRANDIAEQLLEEEDNPFARLALGVREIAERDWEEASGYFDAARLDPLSQLAYAVLDAWALQGAGDTDAALARLDALEGPEWYTLFTSYHAGLIAERADRLDEALLSLDTATETSEAVLRILLARAHVLVRLGRDDEADALLSDIEGADDSPLLADFLDARETGALTSYVPNARAGAAEFLYGLGTLLAREGNEEIAAVYLQLSLELRPENPYALVSLASLYERLEQRDEAVALYEEVPLASNVYRIASLQRAINLAQMERVDDALTLLDELDARFEDDADVVVTRGNILRSEERFEEAAEVYDRAIDLLGDDANWTHYYFRGIAYERSDEWPKAEADFLRALELEPEQPSVLNYLGYSWVDKNMNLEEGLDMIERAVAQRITDGFIVDSLGWAFYRLGRYRDAARVLECAVVLQPADPTLNDHLGDAFWHVDRQREARFQWSHALDLEPEEDQVPLIRAKIADGLDTADLPPASEDGSTATSIEEALGVDALPPGHVCRQS